MKILYIMYEYERKLFFFYVFTNRNMLYLMSLILNFSNKQHTHVQKQRARVSIVKCTIMYIIFSLYLSFSLSLSLSYLFLFCYSTAGLNALSDNADTQPDKIGSREVANVMVHRVSLTGRCSYVHSQATLVIEIVPRKVQYSCCTYNSRQTEPYSTVVGYRDLAVASCWLGRILDLQYIL